MPRAPLVHLAAALLALLPLALAPLALAYPDPDKAPRYFESACFGEHAKRFVFDYVGLMGSEWGPEIEGAACDVYATTSAHVVLVTVPDTEREDLESYALHLFEEWGIGDKDRLDGLLLLYVADYEAQGGGGAVRVEVGYGLEGVINGARAADTVDLMRDAKARALDAGWSQQEATEFALATGMHDVLTTLYESYDGGFPSPERTSPPWWFWVVVVIVVLLIVVALAASAKGSTRGGRRSPGWGYYAGNAAWSHGLGRTFGGGGSGGFGGSFGGGSFGGGRSGGGGGSGRL